MVMIMMMMMTMLAPICITKPPSPTHPSPKCRTAEGWPSLVHILIAKDVYGTVMYIVVPFSVLYFCCSVFSAVLSSIDHDRICNGTEKKTPPLLNMYGCIFCILFICIFVSFCISAVVSSTDHDRICYGIERGSLLLTMYCCIFCCGYILYICVVVFLYFLQYWSWQDLLWNRD